jgi:hypothetical protein
MADNVTVDNGSLTDYTAATDKVTYSGDANVDVQLVRIVQVTGSEGSKTVVDLPGDATNGVDVDVTRIVPGTGATNLGKAEDDAHTTGDVGVAMLAVRTASATDRVSADGDYGNLQLDSIGRLRTATLFKKRSPVTPSISSGAAYASGDVVGAALTFANAAAYNGGSGRVVGAILTDRSTQAAPLELWLFQVSPTLVNADNGVFDITDANLETANLIGVVQFLNYFSTSSGRAAQGTVAGTPLSGAPLSYVCGASDTNIYGAFCVRGTPTYGSTADLVVSLWLEQD